MALFIDKLAIASPTIAPLRRIPDEHAADGKNIAPTLTISGAPEGTVELAVICHDPDAPLAHGFTHWVVYGLPKGSSVVDLTVDGVRTAPNGTGGSEWFGPQPPEGHGQHHYYFWVYALSRSVSGEPDRETFLSRYADAIIEQARLVGTYSR
ncbi:YbhB/YbcL family Raf kinase inhibitor-like protein [Rathayibacter soli]|uniref:YbhB/YbcL family Raf kinase inhibitor-like protein n=1 Tax=Rathayibacter soli TaxID=3144168 RepID=UPI0027E57855|nr:YbhB/YbcL family Raf kinase inhibitor-like protein [Glaciibacter superstes]